MPSHTVELHFLGKSYEFNCPQDQQAHLRLAAEKLDIKMREIQDQTTASREAIILMAALNLSFELSQPQQIEPLTHNKNLAQIEEINRRVESLIENIGIAKT